MCIRNCSTLQVLGPLVLLETPCTWGGRFIMQAESAHRNPGSTQNVIVQIHSYSFEGNDGLAAFDTQ